MIIIHFGVAYTHTHVKFSEYYELLQAAAGRQARQAGQDNKKEKFRSGWLIIGRVCAFLFLERHGGHDTLLLIFKM